MADAPLRIQLWLAKGWRLPPNSVKIDRSTKFGNPYRVGSPDLRYAGPALQPQEESRHGDPLPG
ncbi:DUF4326 domain-containing protein [Xanthobacter oligotrophicus]|uniref:DUF4326 domain-containing protein n=1 Tax=Xanthobacter oligotrophicus TaxID=2607286 RepID=A0ABW6ZS44_9HYPH